MDELEYSCYIFVTNQISDRAIGVQSAHAVAELSILDDENYVNYVRNHKRMVFLNGGTTNKSKNNKGTLNKLFEEILSLNVCKVGSFYEENIGDQLTAFAFIIDEKCYNHKKYPLFDKWLNKIDPDIILNDDIDELENIYPLYFQKYLDYIGGFNRYRLKKILFKSYTI